MGERCHLCKSPLLVTHPELFDLSIAHIDCDAFYASIEKRERPEIADKPLIIGGGNRGVVSTACYIARIRGVKSAMPIFQALKLCPEAIILRPRMGLYGEISIQIRQLMEELSPAVEPISLDEAFIDLSGTEKLHKAPPAIMLSKLICKINSQFGLTASIGLSHNKFLAKIASDIDKPFGFSVIGRAQTKKFLENKPIRLISGVGTATQLALEEAGIHRIGDLLRWSQKDLIKKFGKTGIKLWHLAQGKDTRSVSRNPPMKSISSETTFERDTSDREILEGHLWRACEKISARAKIKNSVGSTVVLKLKNSKHKITTRRIKLEAPTNLAQKLFGSLKKLIDREENKNCYRLLGVSLSELRNEKEALRYYGTFDQIEIEQSKTEKATDEVRAKFGTNAIFKGRALK